MSKQKPQGKLRFSLGILARAVRDPDVGIRFAVSFLLRDVIWESLPIRLRRYWSLVAIAVGLYLCEAVILLCVLRRPDLLPGAKDWDWSHRLGFGQLAIEALALALAIGGALIAIGEIRRALERPRLLLTFEGLSTSKTYHVRRLPGEVWTRDIDLRLWNLADVTAERIRIRLSFENLGPFRVEVIETRRGDWTHRYDLPGTQWVYDPEPSRVLYGSEPEVIGLIRIMLPVFIAEDINTHFDSPNTVDIHAFLLDASSRRHRRQRLCLDFRPWKAPS